MNVLRQHYFDRYDEYLDRLMNNETESKGITFPEFYVFCQFLNSLEDFAIAMRMYSLADRPISEGKNKNQFLKKESWLRINQ